MTQPSSEWESHRKALAYFLRNQTSIGVSGDSGTLKGITDAIEFFARDESLGRLLSDLSAVEKQRDELAAALKNASRALRKILDQNLPIAHQARVIAASERVDIEKILAKVEEKP